MTQMTSRRDLLKLALLTVGAGVTAPFVAGLPAARAGAAGPLETFAQRREWVLDTVAADPRQFLQDGFWAAQVCFLRGDTAAGLELWKARLVAEGKARRRGVQLFSLWPAMHCYLKWEHLLDDEGKALMKPLVTTFVDYSEHAHQQPDDFGACDPLPRRAGVAGQRLRPAFLLAR